MKLLCFPHAGGSAAAFSHWRGAMPTVELHAVELPGRGRRIRTPPIARMDPLIDTLVEELRPVATAPYAIFGHSVGALVGFELAHALYHWYGLHPEHLFVCGHRAPHLRSRRAPLHGLTDADLIAKLRRLGGTPGQVVDHDELMTLILPVVRADLAVSETYRHVERGPLACPLTAFAGSADPVASPDEVAAWRSRTRADFSLQVVDGDHWLPQRDEVTRAVRDVLG